MLNRVDADHTATEYKEETMRTYQFCDVETKKFGGLETLFPGWDGKNERLCGPLCLWDFPGKNTGVHCHFFLQGICLTQESNPNLLQCKNILYW